MAEATTVFAGLGKRMQVFDLDVASGGLAPLQTLTMPAIIQCAWPNRAQSLLYVATSDAGPMVTVKRPDHFVQAFRMLAGGRLEPNGPPLRLGNRPIYVSLDRAEEHILIAYNDPPDVTVHGSRPTAMSARRSRSRPSISARRSTRCG